MTSWELGLSNGVSTISLRLLVPKIRRAKDFGFGPQIPYNATPLGSQGRRRESYTFLDKFSIEKKLWNFENRIVVRSSSIFDDFKYILANERGYFRSPGRGGENSKNAFSFLFYWSYDYNETMCVIKVYVSGISDNFFMSIDWFPASLHQLKVGKYR